MMIVFNLKDFVTFSSTCRVKMFFLKVTRVKHFIRAIFFTFLNAVIISSFGK